MASQIAGGLFNAFAFAGAGYIFSMINKKGYSDEMKRHNKAMEDLARTREEWEEARLSELDRLSKLREARMEGGKDLESTNKDFLSVRTKFGDPPKLKDFYTPSKEMESYMNAVKLAVSVPIIYEAATFFI